MVHGSFESQIVKWRYLIFCIAAAFIAFSTSVSHLITDSYLLFHEGEYVGLLWHMRSFQNGAVEFPLLIHGAMDYLPAMLASLVYGDEHIIVGTRLVNTFITWGCWVMFLDLCYIFTSRASQRALWIGIAILVLFLVTPKLGSQAIAVQQSFLGVRDLFLVAAVWSIAQQSRSTKAFRSHAFLALAGVSTVIALFWSYDRGIISVAFLGTVFLGLVLDRKYAGLLTMGLAVGFSTLLLDQAGPLGSLSENMRNIAYWIGNGKEISGTNIFADWVTLITIMLLLVFCVVAATGIFARKFDRNQKDLFLILGVLVVQVLLLKTVMTRPAMPRLSWAIWPSILMMIHCASRMNLTQFRLTSDAANSPSGYGPYAYKGFAVVFLLMTFFMSPLLLSYGSFVKNVFMPKFDQEMVPAEINMLSRALRGHGDQCVFGWTNEGVVALLLKQRFCTRFPYAVYVARGEEAAYLGQLQADPPDAIVVSVSGVTMLDIGSGPMKSRLPGVNAFIQDNYPERMQVGRYTVASKARPVALPP